jgi:nucleotide-binding universal stress UspA family protein
LTRINDEPRNAFQSLSIEGDWTMRNILVQAGNDPGMATRIESALAIGRRFGAHLSLLISSPYQQFIASDPFGGMYLAKEQLAQAQLADLELERRLGAELAREDVPWDVAVADGDALSTMTLAATLSDLAVVSLGACDRRGQRAPTIAADLALTVPLPVLALPPEGASFDFDAPMMVAWNGSPQAANALRAGVSLMGDARNVILVTVGEDEGRVPAEDALRYMSRYGVHAELRREAKGPGTAEEVLERVAVETKPGLIVMGAFGRPRLRETLFGGVTRYLLEAAPTPLLMAH